jgi:hypothetical protein
MAGSAIYQRETMTVNHGRYYVDVTASDKIQTSAPVISPPCPTCQPSLPWLHKNVFVKNETYDFFLVFGKTSSEQTYQMFVATNRTLADVQNSVKQIRVTVSAPFIVRNTDASEPNAITVMDYNSTSGVVTVNINLKNYTKEFAAAVKKLCVPTTYCKLSGATCVAKDPGTIQGTTEAERTIACGYANKDVDCPTDLKDTTGKTIGCVGFSVTLPDSFVASNQTGDPTSATFLPKTLAMCFPNAATNNPWYPPVTQAAMGKIGTCTKTHAPLICDFCGLGNTCPH